MPPAQQQQRSFVDPEVLQAVESDLSVARMEAAAGAGSGDRLRAAVLLAFAPRTRAAGQAALQALCARLPYPPECAWWLAAAYLEDQQWLRARELLGRLLQAAPADERAAALLQVCAARTREKAAAFGLRALGVGRAALFAVLVAAALWPRPRAAAGSGGAAARQLAGTAAAAAAAAAGEVAAAVGQARAALKGQGGGGGSGGGVGFALPMAVQGLLEEAGGAAWGALAAARRAAGL